MQSLNRRPSLIFKRLGWHLVLALTMLLMQPGAIRHALQHTIKNDAAPAHSTLCKDCLSYCASDALTPQAPVIALAAGLIDCLVTIGQAQCAHRVHAGYQSRAPPSLPDWS